MIGVKGETSCMHAQTQWSTGGYTTQAEHDNCPALLNKQRVQELMVARFGACVEHRPPPPPAGEHGHSLVQVHVDVVSAGGVKGHTTYQLSLKCAIHTDLDGIDHCDIDNVYTIYGAPAVTVGPNAGEPAHLMDFPPAHQEATPFGANVVRKTVSVSSFLLLTLQNRVSAKTGSGRAYGTLIKQERRFPRRAVRTRRSGPSRPALSMTPGCRSPIPPAPRAPRCPRSASISTAGLTKTASRSVS
jgi:hypothetical protein